MRDPSIQVVFAEKVQVGTDHVFLSISPLVVGYNAFEVALVIVAEC